MSDVISGYAVIVYSKHAPNGLGYMWVGIWSDKEIANMMAVKTGGKVVPMKGTVARALQ